MGFFADTFGAIFGGNKTKDKEPTQSLVELLGVRNKKYYCQGRHKDSDKLSRGHPNILGHKVIAEYIYENFLNKYASGKI